MFAILLAAVALTADETPAPKDSPKEAAAKAPPRIITASVKGDKLVTQATVTQVVPVPVTVKEKTKEGKEVDVTRVTMKTETRTIEQSYDLKKATATTAGGKKISLDDLKKKLARPQAIVVSADGNAVDEAYLKLFDKDVIVIVAPMPKVVATPLVVPTPPPPPPPPPLPKVKEKEKD